MTRLLQAMAGAPHGGAEAFFERLAPALGRAGITQRVLIRDNPKRAALLRGQGVDVVEAPFGGALDLVTHWRFRREVKAFKPDIVLTWMNRASRFVPKGPHVTVGRLGGYYDLKYYRQCDHLIGNTPDIRDWIIAQGRPSGQVHYVPNFVADSQGVPPLSRAGLDTPPGAKLIVAMGRLHPNKAFDVLLKAVEQVHDCYLWIAGEGPQRAELEALAAHLSVRPRVRFLGWRDDVAALYATGDLFVCPSRHEPLGNVVIEAWAAARPVIAAASQGPKQLITEGVDGLLVPVDDDQALAQAIRRLLTEPDTASTLAQGGRSAYERQFTEAAVVARYLDFFEKVKR
ncbi:Lipopolysaccharide core biosynthesis glycosyltransferase lpsD [Paramagnetospirillum magnetotacticum MS-1]|uniref:Lipopolysaccharide core biosynthesis glycosyltransferase lpsD n=1 Tax=Paramagnetospirillum magnetotacticum MS-1 TaxID=272627 RepID=A0A0C2YJ79_PARME|nr:glycosyltransferase [Paramagnetospirillum magnetotacticum]KIL99839.1 Lipopolysaccharide core biosynthesis glycosyltransferase lpsD [Paramagnetospirillum magnetotacticum MS-1]